MKKEKYITERMSAKRGQEGILASYFVNVPVEFGDKKKKICKTFRIKDYDTKEEALLAAKVFRDQSMDVSREARRDHRFKMCGKFTVSMLYDMVPKHFPRRKQTYITLGKMYRKYIEPRFGKYYIEDIMIEDVVETLVDVASRCSQQHVNRLKTIWHRIFQEALLQNIPVKDITLIIDTPVSDIFTERSISEQNITEEDFQKFCAGMAEYGHYMPNETRKIYNRQILLYLIKLLRITGMRPQEAKGLQRCDFTFEKLDWRDPYDPTKVRTIETVRIRIAHSIGSTLTDVNVLRKTKTPQSMRILTIGEEGAALVREILAYSLHDLVFSEFHGDPFPTAYVSNYFRLVSKSVGIKVYPLLMRKSFSADLYANSVNPAVIKSLMGHKEENMSLNAYATAAAPDVINASLTRQYKETPVTG